MVITELDKILDQIMKTQEDKDRTDNAWEERRQEWLNEERF